MRFPAVFSASAPPRNGFSLVELLIVIAIIVILIALAVPTVSGVLEKSRAVHGMSNMRQVSAGILNYVADNDGFLPPLYGSTPPWGPPFWSQRVDPYVYDGGSGVTNAYGVGSGPPLVGPAFYCPSVKRHHAISDWSLNSNLAPHASGGANKRVRLVKIDNRATTGLLFEGRNNSGVTDGSWYLNVPLATPGPSSNWFGDWHKGQSFVAFCDGSVQSFRYQTLLNTWTNMVGPNLGSQSELYTP